MFVIGGSSGSLEALLQIFSFLKPDFTVPILIVTHRNNDFDSHLNELLSARSKLQVRDIEDKEPLCRACIYLAPGDYHVLIENDHSFSLDYSEKINYSRPSIDVSFISAANVYKDRLTAVLLSGANNDGGEGMEYALRLGGTTIAQEPREALFPYMPMEAIHRAAAKHILTAAQIADFMNRSAVV